MSNKTRRIDLIRSPNIRFAFSGPEWEILREDGSDQVKGLRASDNGYVKFNLEGSELYITGHYKTPQGRDNAIPSINCAITEGLTSTLMDMQLGIGPERRDFTCAWNSTETPEVAREFSVIVPFPVGVGEDPESEATIDSIHYLPSTTTSEFVTQGASVVYDNEDPHIDFFGAWDTLKDQDGEAVSLTSRQGSAMSVFFTGNSVIWYAWLPAGEVAARSTAFYLIDSGPPVVVNWEKPRLEETQRNYELFRATNLPSGPHNLTVVYQGSDSALPLVLDHLLVGGGNYVIEAERPSPPPPGPATNASTPSDSSSHSPTNARGAPTGAIAGGVVGGLAFLALIILALLWARKRRAHHDQADAIPPPTTSFGHPVSIPPSSSTFTSPTSDCQGREYVSAFHTEENSITASSPIRTGSSRAPTSTSSDHLVARTHTYRKGGEALAPGTEDDSETSTLPRQHQDSGVRLTPNRRSSLPPVYTFD